MMTEELTQMWDKLIELGVSEETLQVCVNGWGNNQETYETILYVTTGYRVFSQVEGEQGVDY